MNDHESNRDSGWLARSPPLVLFLLLAGGAWYSSRSGEGGHVRMESDHDSFVGNAACIQCHKSIVQSFENSPHSRTLAKVSEVPLRERLAGTTVADPSRDTKLEFIERDGKLLVRCEKYASGTPVELQWCFGSGQHAQTLVGVLKQPGGPQWLLQSRLSWYAATNELELTPGEVRDGAATGIAWLGQVSDEGQLRRCFGCHTTHWRESAGLIDFNTMVAGIQCERCHGPRRDHVRAAGREEAAPVPNLRSMSPIESVRWCGGCHRQDQLLGTTELDPHNTQLARFAPIGLVQSKCFRESKPGQALTCLTCHDPHGGAVTDPAYYSRECRMCHNQQADSAGPECKMQPRSTNCLPCHMPKVQVGMSEFTDHWIRVRNETPDAASHEPATQ